MIYDLQKASMWKRISAFLFDLILLSIVSVLFAWALSKALGYDRYQTALQDRRTYFGQEYGVNLEMPLSEYDQLTEEENKLLETAYDALSADPAAVKAYGMIVQLTILITSFSLLLGYLVMEFFIPMRQGNGMTLGKRIFGLGVMQTDGVKITNVLLFVRAILGKYAIETMIPAFIVMMLFWGSIGIVGLIVLGLILIVEAAVMISTPTNSLIHDLLANTVVVDYASQMIFETREDMIHYKEKIHAEMAAKQEY